MNQHNPPPREDKDLPHVTHDELTAREAVTQQQDAAIDVKAPPMVATPDQHRQNSKQAVKSSGNDSLATTLLACLFVLVLVLAYFFHTRLSALEAQGTLAENILIIDYQSVFAGLPEDVTGEQANEIFNRVHERILALQDAGYIVLDSNAVLAAPVEYRIEGSFLLDGEL